MLVVRIDEIALCGSDAYFTAKTSRSRKSFPSEKYQLSCMLININTAGLPSIVLDKVSVEFSILLGMITKFRFC